MGDVSQAALKSRLRIADIRTGATISVAVARPELMPPTATIEHEATDERRDRRARCRARVDAVDEQERSLAVGAGVAMATVGTIGTLVWLAWRVTHLSLDPVSVAFLLAEVAGLLGGLAVASGLAERWTARSVFVDEPRDSHWFAHSVADLVGRTRADDLHHDVRSTVRGAPRWRWRDSADAAIVAVLLDGPRRLLMVIAVTLGLLFGVSPFGAPPWWAIVALGAGGLGIATAHVVLGRGRIRYGDRTRWTYGAIGEVVGRADVDGLAPRRWVGAIASAVAVSVAVGLRGMSDRWTHGLPAMDDDERVVLLAVAAGLILGALYTLATSQRPTQVDAHLVSRHLEERTARQAVLAVAVVLGMVGLVAGLLPTEQVAEPAPTVSVPAGEAADG